MFSVNVLVSADGMQETKTYLRYFCPQFTSFVESKLFSPFIHQLHQTVPTLIIYTHVMFLCLSVMTPFQFI